MPDFVIVPLPLFRALADRLDEIAAASTTLRIDLREAARASEERLRAVVAERVAVAASELQKDDSPSDG